MTSTTARPHARSSITRWVARSDEHLVAAEGEVITEACVLRAFDRCRRELSRLIAEDDGIFVGYDLLEFSAIVGATREVRVSATLREDLGGRHSVEYRAMAVSPAVDGSPPHEGTSTLR